MLAASLMSLVLLTLAGVLLDAHRRDWRERERGAQDAEAVRFLSVRGRRRLAATTTIAVVGVLIALWPVTPREPAWVLAYAGVLGLLATLIFALGAWDAWSSGKYYERLSRQRLAEQAEQLRQAAEAARAAADSEAAPL